MKNTCKRLFSLMLAVVLLVSVVPFQASADTTKTIFEVWDDADPSVCHDRVVLDGQVEPDWSQVTIPEGYEQLYLLSGDAAIDSKGNSVYYFMVTKSKDENTVTVKVVWQDGNKAVEGADKVPVTITGTEPSWDDIADLLPANIEKISREQKGDIWKFTIAPKAAEEKPEPKPETKTVKITVKVNGEELTALKEVALDAEPDSSWIKAAFGEYDSANYKKVGNEDTNGWYVSGNDYSIRLEKIEKPVEVKEIKVTVKVGTSGNVVANFSKAPENGEYSLVKNLLKYEWNSEWDGVYEFDHAWSTFANGSVGLDSKIKAGDDISIMLKKVNDEDEEESGDKNDTKKVYMTVYVGDEKIVDKESITVDADETFRYDGASWLNEVMDYDSDKYDLNENKGGGDGWSHNDNEYTVWLIKDTGSSKEMYKAYLNIFVGKNFDDPKTISIYKKGQIGYDGIVTMDEVKDLVKDYYSAKDSDGISYDGIYVYEGSAMDKWQKDEKYSKITDLNERREDHTVYLSVWIDNAKAKSSSSSSDNPKTGDEIFMTVTVMAISATALAGAYFFNKKRMAK